MFTELRKDWRHAFAFGPRGGLHEYIRDVLRVEDLCPLTNDDAWAELPYQLRCAILHVALLEKTTGRFPELDTVGRIAAEHAVRSDWILMAHGWMPPAHVVLDETSCTVLRLSAAVDRYGRAEQRALLRTMH